MVSDKRRVAISGSTGLLGAALTSRMSGHNWEVRALTRERPPPEGAAAIRWNPARDEIDAAGLEGVEAVINLAGESIADGRWNEERKRRIKESRVKSTDLLCRTLATLKNPPKVLISASAVGFYGNRGDEILTEESSSGDTFLAEVCREWEAATAPAQDKGIRVVALRLGAILSKRGGVLGKLLTPFKAGLGGPVGSGSQYMSLIAIQDLLGIIYYLLDKEGISGPINAVGPSPVTNKDFVKNLGYVLKRPAILPAPSFALRLALGEMADELLLSSQRAHPARLQATGYLFRGTNIESALRMALVD